MSADTALMPIPGAVDPVPVARAAKPREDGRVQLIGLTRDLAQQWTGRRGIRVNALAPGFFESEMTDTYQPGYLDAVTTLAIVLPITTTDRGWPNHISVDGPSGLDRPSWIMTEQPRTLSRDRITRVAGEVSAGCLASVRLWLSDFFDL